MQIIWDPEIVNKVKDKYTLLELETFDYKDMPVTAYCVLTAEKIGLSGFATLDKYMELHKAFIGAYNNKDYKICEDAGEYLMGAFGGELDSFYEIILGRIKTQNITEPLNKIT